MPKKIIFKQQIIQAAQVLIANNINPTLAAIRKHLNNCGSNSTIHKYFWQWKQECFKNFNNSNKIINIDDNLLEDRRILKLNLQKINLQTRVDSLYKELTDLKKQLIDTVLKHQIQTQRLLRQINEQQKIIQDHIGFKKLYELIGEQEVMLHINNKLGVAYGK